MASEVPDRPASTLPHTTVALGAAAYQAEQQAARRESLRYAAALHAMTCDDNPGHQDWDGCATTGPCADEGRRLATVLALPSARPREEWVCRHGYGPDNCCDEPPTPSATEETWTDTPSQTDCSAASSDTDGTSAIGAAAPSPSASDATATFGSTSAGLPEIPVEAFAVAARADSNTEARLIAAWPYLYAAALRDIGERMNREFGQESNGWFAVEIADGVLP